jgi:hypothetical protein
MRPQVMGLRSVLLAGLSLVVACADSTHGLEVAHGQSSSNVAPQQSTNWCGYQLAGAPGGFNQVSATWTVPSITKSSDATASSTWTGIGGGCAESSCTVVDPTLIQAGIEADNNGDGTQSYSAWWEAIPAPSVQAGSPLDTGTYDVRPGDRISVSIDGSNLVVWNIAIVNLRGGAPHWTFTTTVPYTAAGLTAEWIEEAPLVFGTNGAGQISLSNFGKLSFTQLIENTMKPSLGASGAIEMVDGNGKVICSPSPPSSKGFNVCYGSGSCR